MKKNKTIVIDGITYTMERIPYTTKYVLKEEEEKKSVRIREPYARRFKVIQLGGWLIEIPYCKVKERTYGKIISNIKYSTDYFLYCRIYFFSLEV